MDRSPFDDSARTSESTHKRHRELSDWTGEGKLAIVRDQPRTIANHTKHSRVICLAQSRRGLDQRIEYPLQIEGRPADNLQDFGGSRLLFQGFCQLPFARLLVRERSRVRDGNDGLVGEGLE